MIWAVRLHWRLVIVGTLVACLMLGGFAFARGFGLMQTGRVAVVCAETNLMAGHAVGRAAVVKERRRTCQGHSLPHRGLSRRVAVGALPGKRQSPTSLAAPTASPVSDVATAVTPEGKTPTPPPPPGDTIPPQTLITSGPAKTTTSTSANFAFASTEAGSSFECRLDSGEWGPCGAPTSYTDLNLGTHEFAVRAVDQAENIDTTPAARTWTVEEATTPPPPSDTTPPQTSITSGPASTTSSTSATFAFSSSEAGSTFECNLDSAGWGTCISPTPYSALALGAHLFSVRAIDTAGNVDATPATRSWTVEERLPPPPPPPPPAECTTVVTSTSAAESAVSAAAEGAVICLADGSYGEVSISASKSTQVTLEAEHPGGATIAGASLDGSHLTLARFEITNEVTVQPGSEAMAIEYNRITGGYMGINAGPTTSESISDTTIRGNRLVGPFGEDALRINRYHDSADPDPYGILIEGNEITGVRENGNHSDCLQSVWGGDGLYFRRNYLHDNRCQGFFVKDQPATIVGINVEDNLFLRNSEPCDGDPGCGQPSYLQIFGPYQDFTMRRNTVWEGEVVASFQEGTGSGTSIESNVVDRFWTNTDLSAIAYSDNTRCRREATAGGSWPAQAPGETVDCAPAFNDPASDDFRLLGSDRGVDWAPAEQHYGP